MVFNRKVDQKVNGMESIAFMREVIVNDEKLAEQADILQNNFNDVNQEMIEREFNPNLTSLSDLDVDSNEYELFNRYIFGLSTLLSTKKLMTSLGIEFDSTSETDFRSLMFLNKDVQSILPELVRRMLICFNGAMETGEFNELYQYLYDTLREDVVKYPTYNYDVIGSNFATVDEYEEYIDSVVEKITERMYQTRFTMGILMYYNENSFVEAKEKIKTIFEEHGVDISVLMNEVMPEQLISEPSQFQTLLQNFIGMTPEIADKLSDPEVQNEIQIKIRDIMIELANANAINKFNQTNGMMGNVFPTINISELIVMALAKLSFKITNTESTLSEEEEEVIKNLDGITFDKLGNREINMGIRLNDVHLNLLSTISYFVSSIVVDQLSLRAIDGSFQTMCSSVMQILVPIINELIQEHKDQLENDLNDKGE